MRNTGQYGENLAAEYLNAMGYEIITRNWHCRSGEIDIVARKNAILIFVEVRSRKMASTESAFASITPRKQERLIKSAYEYLEAHDLPSDVEWRIDVIAIALSKPPIIDHVEDALGWS